jgi:hypothetical protein
LGSGVREQNSHERSLPWLASLFAAVLLSTPTYGIGVAIAPLTLIGSWIALQHGTRNSTATRVGVALNLFLVVAGLSGLTVVWGLNGWLVTAWGLVVVILLLWYTTLDKCRQPGAAHPSAARSRGDYDGRLRHCC